MRRREFMGLVGGAAITWPVAARAQQQMPVIGWLFGVSAQAGQPPLTAFRKALGAEGFVEGQNVQIEYRWADSQYDKLPAMAADLVAKSVTVIVAAGGDPAGHAAKAATSTIPIVIVTGSDPVKEGFVPNLNRPGGNVTGATIFSYENGIQAPRPAARGSAGRQDHRRFAEFRQPERRCAAARRTRGCV